MLERTVATTVPKQSNKPRFGLITPSYVADFERCKLLCFSRERCLPSDVKHYIIVDRRDVPLFQQLRNQNTEILVVEDIVPWWIKRIPFSKQGWISFKGLPVRNWILQQIVKLSVAKFLDEDVLGFVDSDVVFVHPFDPQTFVRDGKVRLYREPNSIPEEWQNFQRWYETGSNLLKVPPVTYRAPNYIGDLITWKKSNVLKLHRYLEDLHGRSWIETMARCLHFSEYIVYGMYVDNVLKEDSGHYYDELYPGLQYFSTEPMSASDAKNFFADVKPHHITAMVSAKSGTDLNYYQDIVKNILDTSRKLPV